MNRISKVVRQFSNSHGFEGYYQNLRHGTESGVPSREEARKDYKALRQLEMNIF